MCRKTKRSSGPSLYIYSLHDHVHLSKDTVNMFAKNLKYVALGRTPGSPSESNRESSKPQPRRHLIPASPHSIFPSHPAEPWKFRQRNPMPQHLHPSWLCPHPELQHPSFRPPHPAPGPFATIPSAEKTARTQTSPIDGQQHLNRAEACSTARVAGATVTAALKGPSDTHSTNLREIKDMLNLICTRLMY